MFVPKKAFGFGGKVLLVATLLASRGFAQVADGNLVGSILDPTGAVVPKAKVEAENVATGVKSAATADADGTYRFNNLLIGRYNITASASGFANSRKQVEVVLSTTTTANLSLGLATAQTSIDVTASAVLLDTTTAQIANIYSTRLASDLPAAANPSGSYLNLSLLSAGVASSGGIGAGTGPSIGGQRPRNNNFTVESSDNNSKYVTGPVVNLPNDAVAELAVLRNQFNAEFGHSSGGQFNAVIKSGTNDIHGTAYEYLQNRNLDALDQIFKRQNILTAPRYDSNLFGGNVGGPIIKNKLFYFADLDYNPSGFAATSAAVSAPTTAGYQTLMTVPGASLNNVSALQQNLGSAPQANGTVMVGGTAIPVGTVPILAPAYVNTFRWLTSADYNLSDSDQIRARYIANQSSRIDTAAELPQFFAPRQTSSLLASLSEFHTFAPDLGNEFRLAYNRFNDNIPVTNAQFPGLDVFPNLYIGDLGAGVQIGPDPNGPQAVVQNTSQLADTISWIKGRHSMKFGFDGRDLTSGINFIQRVRGDYEYSTLERYVLDLGPDYVAQRTVGGSKPYAGNSISLFGFADDDWKISRHLTVSAGLRYEFNSVARSMQEFALNSLANVPGVLTFFAPQPQKANFAPRLGFAYSPGNNATTTIRGGFGIAYDQIFDNIGTNVRPPEVNSVVNAAVTNNPGFLADGGILANSVAAPLTPALARAATTGWFGDQKLGYAVSWNFGIQHVFGKDWVLDIGYLGDHGVHLLLQTELNRAALVTPTNFLPTYLQAPSQSTLDALPVTLNSIKSGTSNILASSGFTSNITSYVPQGESKYQGLATELTRRFSAHTFFKAAYTWSHTEDNSTMEINFTSLSPRRPQDFFNLSPEWASSALDRRHRGTVTWLYAIPWMEKNHNWFLRNIIGNYQVSGTYTVESPEYVTPQSAVDSNLNGDSAGDRVIVNVGGIPNIGSGVTTLKNTAGLVVGYLAKNPNAEFIQAQSGALANSGRNILASNGINNFDFNIIKRIALGEQKRLELRADFYNGLNHPQYTPGRINSILSTGTTHVGETSTLNPASALFDQWNQVYSSNPRVIQVAAKFTF